LAGYALQRDVEYIADSCCLSLNKYTEILIIDLFFKIMYIMCGVLKF